MATAERQLLARAPEPGRSAGTARRIWPVGAVLGLLALWTLVPFFTLLGGRGVFNGGYGIDLPDQMQYMAFIRDSGEHGLISNMFDVVPPRHLLLDPGFAVSGLLWRLGASIQLSLLIWVPIVALAVAVGFRAYARRLLGPDRRLVALGLLLALFYFTPALPLTEWLQGSPSLKFGTSVVALETFAGAYPWGTVSGLSMALMPVFLLLLERVLDPGHRPPGRSALRYMGGAALAGGIAAWLHPWQGMVLLATVAGLVAWGRFHRRHLLLTLPVLATAAPLVYFYLLSHTASAFGIAGRPDVGYQHFGTWFALGMAPFLLALPGYPARPAFPDRLDIQERIVRLWPVATLLVYVALDRSWFYHLFDGVTLPLSILAVTGGQRMLAAVSAQRVWRRRLLRAAATSALLAVTLPGLVWVVLELVRTRDQNFLRPGEARALAFLDRSPVPGAVLAPAMPLGQAVPAYAGRQTYVGHYEWTPDMRLRSLYTDALFEGRLRPAQAAALVRESRASFLASDCAHPFNLASALDHLIVREWRFGCAVVYQVRRV